MCKLSNLKIHRIKFHVSQFSDKYLLNRPSSNFKTSQSYKNGRMIIIDTFKPHTMKCQNHKILEENNNFVNKNCIRV